MKKNTIFVLSVLLLILTISCDKNEEWIYLFDGNSTDGWRGYNSKSIPPGWTAKDGMLMFDTELELEQNYKGGKDIIYGKEEFENFELYVEWKIPVGGNSGIFYHIKEGYGGPPEISPEYQLIDDINYATIHDLKSYNEQFGSCVSNFKWSILISF